MIVSETIDSIESLLAEARHAGQRVGLVPTMGALHQAHLSLIDFIRDECDLVVLWIFLNPKQFNSSKDFEQYPRVLQEDLAVAKEAGVDVVFAPPAEEIYPRSDLRSVELRAGSLANRLCGASRPGHFDGVLTVVSKFFNIIQPDVAVFGEKDYQQLKVIEQMVRDLNYPVKILAAPLIRDVDGLAFSSRNSLLSEEDRIIASGICRGLQRAYQGFCDGEARASELLAPLRDDLAVIGEIDYIDIVDCETLESLDRVETEAQLMVAVIVAGVRLIDNIRLFRNPNV